MSSAFLNGFRLGHPAVGHALSSRAEKQLPPVGLIIGGVVGGLLLLVFAFIVVGGAVDRRRERARVAREGGNPADAPVPDVEARFQRSGADLAPVMQQVAAPVTPMVAVPLTPAAGGAAEAPRADPFRTPPASPKAPSVAPTYTTEDPFADEVAAMQARLQEKFKVAHDRYNA